MGAKNPDNSAATPRGALRSSFSLWVAALAAVLALLLHESLFEGKGLLPADGMMSFPPWEDLKGPSNILLADQFLVFIPQKEFVYQQFQHGHFPLWNPYIDCGVPNLGSFQGALLFPINLLLLPLAPFYASGIAAFLKLFLAGWFTMLYLRSLGASNSGAFLSGLVFSLSAFMIVWLGHPHVNSAMWMPLLLYLMERFFQNVRARLPVLRISLAFAVVCGFGLLGGHPPTMVHMAFFAGAYFLFRWWPHRREMPVRLAGLLVGAAIVGFLLAAPAVLPFFEYDRHSSEALSSNALQRSQMYLPLNSLIFYLMPKIDGSPVDGWEDTLLRLFVGKWLPNYNERTGYVGILPLLLALYAAVKHPSRLTWFYAAAIPICFLFICGVPPLPSILTALPILHAMNPMRLILMVGFSVAVLAGLGWDAFRRNENERWQRWLIGLFWLAIGLFLLGYAIAVAPRWHVLETACRNFLCLQLLMLGGSFLVSLTLFLGAIRRNAALLTLLVFGWTAVDLLEADIGYNPAIPHDRYYPPTPAVTWLQQHTGHQRILGMPTPFEGNASEIFGLRDTRGCDFTSVRRYEELMTGGAGDFHFCTVVSSLPEPMPLLGVKYLMTFGVPNPDTNRFELVFTNMVNIYRYGPACDRALAVYDYHVEPDPATVLKQVRSGTFDPQRMLLLEEEPPAPPPPAVDAAAATNSSVRFVTDEADRVTVEADFPKPGFLLLLDTYFPGWTATVNGSSAKIYRADYNFRAVPVPAGKSTVDFSYRPASFRIGLMLSATGWLIVGILFLWSVNSNSPAGKTPS
ncbi:MAG TPA: YfhO family protein [Verrucomicrobiae bacterium]